MSINLFRIFYGLVFSFSLFSSDYDPSETHRNACIATILQSVKAINPHLDSETCCSIANNLEIISVQNPIPLMNTSETTFDRGFAKSHMELIFDSVLHKAFNTKRQSETAFNRRSEKELTCLAWLWNIVFKPREEAPVCYDLGCGPGITSILLSLMGVKVIGIDCDYSFLDKAILTQNKLEADRIQQLITGDTHASVDCTFLKADLREYHFSIAADIVFAGLLLHEFSPYDAKKVVRNVYTGLKEGGIAIFSFNGIYSFRDATTLDSAQDAYKTAKSLGYHFPSVLVQEEWGNCIPDTNVFEPKFMNFIHNPHLITSDGKTQMGSKLLPCRTTLECGHPSDSMMQRFRKFNKKIHDLYITTMLVPCFDADLINWTFPASDWDIKITGIDYLTNKMITDGPFIDENIVMWYVEARKKLKI